MILSDHTDKPEDIMAALILQYFELPHFSIARDPVTLREHKKGIYLLQTRGIKKLRVLLDLFFT